MKVRYQFHTLSREERVVMQCILLDEMEKQNWFAIVFLELWRTEGFVCTQ